MRKSILIVLSMLMVLSMLACQNTTPAATSEAALAAETAAPAAETVAEEAEPLTIAYCTQNLSNVYWVDYSNALRYNCEKEGWKFSVVDGANDAAKQLYIMEYWITQGVDVIVISPVDTEVIAQAIVQAKEAGIIVINDNANMTVDAVAETFSARVVKDEHLYGYLCGKMAAQHINENLNGTGKIAILNKPINSTLIIREQGILDAIAELAPNAEVVAQIAASNNEDGMRAAETVLQESPDVNVFCGINDGGVLGAYEALKAAGKTPDDVACIGLDATSAAIKLIKQGTMYVGTVDVNSFGISEIVVQTIKQIKDGTLAERDVVIPLLEVTIANIDDIIARNAVNSAKMATVQ